MAIKTAANVAQVQVRGSLDGEQVENVFYFQHAGPIVLTMLESLVADVAGAVTEAFLPLLPDSWVGREVYAFDMTSGATIQATDTSILSSPGTAGDQFPNNVTIAVARKTGNRGRSTNGRIFWMGLTSSEVTENTVTAAFEEAVINALTTLHDAVDADGWTPVTVSFQHDGIVTSAGVVTPIAAWVFTDNVIDSRRRRLPGRGV